MRFRERTLTEAIATWRSSDDRAAAGVLLGEHDHRELELERLQSAIAEQR